MGLRDVREWATETLTSLAYLVRPRAQVIDLPRRSEGRPGVAADDLAVLERVRTLAAMWSHPHRSRDLQWCGNRLLAALDGTEAGRG